MFLIEEVEDTPETKIDVPGVVSRCSQSISPEGTILTSILTCSVGVPADNG